MGTYGRKPTVIRKGDIAFTPRVRVRKMITYAGNPYSYYAENVETREYSTDYLTRVIRKKVREYENAGSTKAGVWSLSESDHYYTRTFKYEEWRNGFCTTHIWEITELHNVTVKDGIASWEDENGTQAVIVGE